MGAFPLIPFKSNTVPTTVGTWGRMYHYFSYNRDEFLARYHRRSNVESTFSMIKAKFGDGVRSKTDTAMKNECLCKFLCSQPVRRHPGNARAWDRPDFSGRIIVCPESHCHLGICGQSRKATTENSLRSPGPLDSSRIIRQTEPPRCGPRRDPRLRQDEAPPRRRSDPVERLAPKRARNLALSGAMPKNEPDQRSTREMRARLLKGSGPAAASVGKQTLPSRHLSAPGTRGVALPIVRMKSGLPPG